MRASRAALSLSLSWLLLTVTSGCDRPERTVRDLLQDQADAIARGDRAAACARLWYADRNPDRCDEYLRRLATLAPGLAGGRVSLESFVPYGHGAGAHATAAHVAFHLICSRDRATHVAGPGCTWWVESAAPAAAPSQ